MRNIVFDFDGTLVDTAPLIIQTMQAAIPIKIVRTLDNCYPNSRAVLDSITNTLNPRLAEKLQPALYGDDTLRRIEINTAMSFYDDFHCKTNYIIADESLKPCRDYRLKMVAKLWKIGSF